MPNQYRSTPYPPEEIAQWEAALDEGMGYKHVGEVFGVSRMTVARYLPGRGWTRQQLGQHSQLIQRSGV